MTGAAPMREEGARKRSSRPLRQTVDLSGYPDLVVIYLGMRANSLRGLGTVLRFGPRISASVRARPGGLLVHETLFYSLFPLHAGIRQYWWDFDALFELWARTLTHQRWWKTFLADRGGTSFWHETYFMRGGTKAVDIDMWQLKGLLGVAPVQEARGSMFSARRRLRLQGAETTAPAVDEGALYPGK